MIKRPPEILHSFKNGEFSFTCMTTREILTFSQEEKATLTAELKRFFPIIFKESQDWEYMVRHFFYLPRDGTIRQAVFVRNIEKELLALCAFDTGIFTGESRKIKLVYVHIRAVLPEYRNHHLGRIFSQKILTCLKPDMLMTTCVQLSSLYSWIRIKNEEILAEYQFFPQVETREGSQSVRSLPLEEIETTLGCFRNIYTSHVKENQERVNGVVNNITVRMVRKGVNTFFDHPKWHENNRLSDLAKDLGVTEKDSILLVIRKKDFYLKPHKTCGPEKIRSTAKKCSKYHSFGNSFIILDEIRPPGIIEEKKNDFALEILNPDTGIGADGLIILSPPESPGKFHGNRAGLPLEEYDYVFRHFEPDGTESLMCLNGLLITAMYVSQVLGKNSFKVLTSTNSFFPQILTAGVDADNNAFVQGLRTTCVDKTLADPKILKPFSPSIDRIIPLELKLRRNDLLANPVDLKSIETLVQIPGYLTFSGEPHLVVFTDQMHKDQTNQDQSFTDLIFQRPSLNRRRSAGDRFIETVGMRIQHTFSHLFPRGLNITFMTIVHKPWAQGPVILYRCFERAIEKETLSCGTGALACSSVALALGLVKPGKIITSPYLFNRQRPGSFYTVESHSPGVDQWRLSGQPEIISTCFCFKS